MVITSLACYRQLKHPAGNTETKPLYKEEISATIYQSQADTSLCTHQEMTSVKCSYRTSTPHTEMVYLISTELMHCKDRRRARECS